MCVHSRMLGVRACTCACTYTHYKTWSFYVAQTMPPHLFRLCDFFFFNFKIHDGLFLF